jgi:hypothetical protein
MGGVRKQLDTLLALCRCNWPPSAAATGKEEQHAGAFDPFDLMSTVALGASNSGSSKQVSIRPPTDQGPSAVAVQRQQLACNHAAATLVSPPHSSAGTQPLAVFLQQPSLSHPCTSTPRTTQASSAAATAVGTVAESVADKLVPLAAGSDFSRQILPKQPCAVSVWAAPEAKAGAPAPFQTQRTAGTLHPYLRRPATNGLVLVATTPEGKDCDSCSGGEGVAAVPGPLAGATLGQPQASIQIWDTRSGGSRLPDALPLIDQVPVPVKAVSQGVNGEASRPARKSALRGLPRSMCTEASSATKACGSGSRKGWLDSWQ